MQREILFRGFNKDENGIETIYLNKEEIKGNWEYGYLFKIWDKCYILWGMTNDIPNMIEVIQETVGQYTGLDDKNGKKIFEGNVVHICYGKRENIYQIIFDKQELDFKATNGKENYEDSFQYLGCCDEIEVIGTIFDEKGVE